MKISKQLTLVTLLMLTLILSSCDFKAMFGGDEDSGSGGGSGGIAICGFDFDGFYEDGGETGEFNFNTDCENELEDFVEEKFEGLHCNTTPQSQSELNGEFLVITTDDGIRKHDVTFDGNGNGSVSGDDEVELHYNVCENRGIQIFAQSPDGHNDILMGALAKGGGFLFATSAKGIDKHNGNQQDDEGPKFVIGIQKTGANDPSTSSYYDVSFITSDNAGYVKFTFNDDDTVDVGKGDDTCTGTWDDSETPGAIDVTFSCEEGNSTTLMGFVSEDQQKLLIIEESGDNDDNQNSNNQSEEDKKGAIAFGTLNASKNESAIHDYYFGFSIKVNGDGNGENDSVNIDTMFIDFTDGSTFKYNALSCDNDCYGEGTFTAGPADGTFSATVPGENGDETHNGYVNEDGDLIHIPGGENDYSLTVLVKVGEKDTDDGDFQDQLDDQGNQP
jgi:hypothetical protein